MVYINMKLFVNILFLYFSVGIVSVSKRLDLMLDFIFRFFIGVNYFWFKNKFSLF